MNLGKLVAFDVECYTNYVLIKFKRYKDGKLLEFESLNDSEIRTDKLKKLLKSDYTFVSFNGLKYDALIIAGVLKKYPNRILKKISDDIIAYRMMTWDVEAKYRLSSPVFDHIDIMDVLPLKASLKTYGGRYHSRKLQDLPIDPGEVINREQACELSAYCENDLDTTLDLIKAEESEIALRRDLGKKYNLDCRSMSDAKIAETVLLSELEDRYDIRVRKVNFKKIKNKAITCPGVSKLRNMFSTYALRDLCADYRDSEFIISDSGKPKTPDVLKNRVFEINGTTYKIGKGGLHSCEKSTFHSATDNWLISDFDVASYYPSIVLNNDLYPSHIGREFLDIYSSIVRRRLTAKQQLQSDPSNTHARTSADSLKIIINSAFGKLGSKYSKLYAPELLLAVTVTGQLSLLALIERFELANIHVISANTDGVVCKYRPRQREQLLKITQKWEQETRYVLEESRYRILASRDVNNYVAVFENGKVKGKGYYTDQNDHYNQFRTNPNMNICKHAIRDHLSTGSRIERTIADCEDIKQFAVVRKVSGGAVKNGTSLGSALRWYYDENELDGIYYLENNNMVPKSAGAIPILELPNSKPTTLNHELYIEEAINGLADLGVFS